MSDYSRFFLSSHRSVVELELVEISHPSFSQTYYIVTNALDGVTVTHEDTTTKVYTYYPMKIDDNGVIDDLDSSMTMNFGDLGEILSGEIDRIRSAGTFDTKPTVKYRLYRSDDLTKPIYGPFKFEVPSVGITDQGSAITAQAPRLNVVVTGEYYTTTRFVMLRAVL